MGYKNKSIPQYREYISRLFELSSGQAIVLNCDSFNYMKKLAYNLSNERRLFFATDIKGRFDNTKIKIAKRSFNNEFCVVLSLQDLKRKVKVEIK